MWHHKTKINLSGVWKTVCVRVPVCTVYVLQDKCTTAVCFVMQQCFMVLVCFQRRLVTGRLSRSVPAEQLSLLWSPTRVPFIKWWQRRQCCRLARPQEQAIASRTGWTFLLLLQPRCQHALAACTYHRSWIPPKWWVSFSWHRKSDTISTFDSIWNHVNQI